MPEPRPATCSPRFACLRLRCARCDATRILTKLRSDALRAQVAPPPRLSAVHPSFSNRFRIGHLPPTPACALPDMPLTILLHRVGRPRNRARCRHKGAVLRGLEAAFSLSRPALSPSGDSGPVTRLNSRLGRWASPRRAMILSPPLCRCGMCTRVCSGFLASRVRFFLEL